MEILKGNRCPPVHATVLTLEHDPENLKDEVVEWAQGIEPPASLSEMIDDDGCGDGRAGSERSVQKQNVNLISNVTKTWAMVMLNANQRGED